MQVYFTKYATFLLNLFSKKRKKTFLLNLIWKAQLNLKHGPKAMACPNVKSREPPKPVGRTVERIIKTLIKDYSSHVSIEMNCITYAIGFEDPA